jgi:hypothetical protein
MVDGILKIRFLNKKYREKLNTASLSTILSLDRDTHFCQAVKSK